MSVLETIYLHIGLEKTGTKTLQTALAVNRQLLLQHGFIFPRAPGPYTHLGLAIYAANEGAVPDLRKYVGLFEQERYLAFLEAHPAELARELGGSACQTAIFSNEHCSSRLSSVTEIAKLRRLLRPLARQCSVIVYLRRQDDLAVSRYSTFVQSGATAEFCFPSGVPWFDYLRLLDMWAEVFGRDNLVIRIFEPAQMKGGDLLADFFSIIGFAGYGQLQRPADQNRSLDVHTLEFLRRFNAHVPVFTDNAVNLDRGDVAEALAGIAAREPLRPSPEAATAFMIQFAQSNAEVARKYLHRPDDALFSSEPRGDRRPRTATLDAGKAVEIAAALWRWQQGRIRQLQSKDEGGSASD